MVVAAAPSSYWFITRATGAMALVLLTGSVALGIASVRRMELANLRFVVDALHRSVSLLAVVFVLLHVVTTLLDGFAPIGVLDVVIPFRSAYRPVWLGLGTVALDLAGGGDDHEPDPSARRLSRVARDALAGLRQLAARPCPQLRDRHRPEGRTGCSC